MQLWLAQMLLNFCWSPVFFRFHNMALGLAIILTLLALIVSFFIVQAFVRYAAWVSFASILNYSLYRFN